MKVYTFLIQRIIRLYPMILIGVLFGVSRFLGQNLIEGCDKYCAPDLFKLFTLNILMIPQSIVGSVTDMYPLNAPIWSLFFEGLAYFFFCVALWRMRDWMLVIVIGAAVPGLVIWMLGAYGGGVSSSFSDNVLLTGGSRVMFSFVMGMLIHRHMGLATRFLGWMPAFTFLLAFLAVAATPSDLLPMPVAFATVTLLFPVIVLNGITLEVPSPMVSIARFFGNLSYPLYIVHVPLIWSMAAIAKKAFGDEALVWAGVVILPVTIAVAYGLFWLFDIPVRRWLIAQVNTSSKSAQAVGAGRK